MPNPKGEHTATKLVVEPNPTVWGLLMSLPCLPIMHEFCGAMKDWSDVLFNASVRIQMATTKRPFMRVGQMGATIISSTNASSSGKRCHWRLQHDIHGEVKLIKRKITLPFPYHVGVLMLCCDCGSQISWAKKRNTIKTVILSPSSFTT